MHTPLPPLPNAYGSWTQVLTDWGVIRAFKQAGMPNCFKARPELAAPFVAEIGAAILQKQLHRHSLRVLLIKHQVTEPAYEHTGGSAYREIRQTLESAQRCYLEGYCRHRAGEQVADLDILRGEMERHQTAFDSIRRAHEGFIQQTRCEAVRTYWNKRPIEGISDVFFADAALHAAALRLQRLHPPWWGKFHRGLQLRFKHGHPAEGYLLDVLPQLRAQAKKKKYAAVIDEWCEANAMQWGWDGKCHHRMRARRGAKKATQLETWFKAVAPGYLTDSARRHALHTDLSVRLSEADPWHVPVSAAAGDFRFTGHGRN